jgi:hypothetical protein
VQKTSSRGDKLAPFLYTAGVGAAGILAFASGIQILKSAGILCLAFSIIGTLAVINQFFHHRANEDLLFTSVNGFGSSLFTWTHGEKDKLGHEWLTAFFLPIVPIASYRVLSKETTGLFARKYHLDKVGFRHKQALTVYAVYFVVVTLIALLTQAM